MSPSTTLPDQLLDGFRRFRSGRYPVERERFRRLGAEGQRPGAVIVACSDSRSAPETVFDAHPGELFVVRNVAGLVPVYDPQGEEAASAALEFAVLELNVRSIVVMGHGRCGGIAAALDQPAPLTPTDFVGRWVAGLRDLAGEMEPSDWVDPARRQRMLEGMAVEQSIANLRTFPWIRVREREGSLTLHGAWFDISLGELHALGTGGWLPLPGG